MQTNTFLAYQHLKAPITLETNSDLSLLSWFVILRTLIPEHMLNRFPKWKLSMLSFAAATSTILLINLIATLAAPNTEHNTMYQGIKTVDTGSSRAGTVFVHLIINIFGTCVLCASSFCMQCLAAPTRSDVDSAHKVFSWMEIGVHSVRNIVQISGKRAALWLVLGLSSIPLHLLYNSAVFFTVPAQLYQVFLVNHAFADPAGSTDWKMIPENPSKPYEWVNAPDEYWSRSTHFNETSTLALVDELYELLKKTNSSFDKLDGHACHSAYSRQMQSTRSHVLLVLGDSSWPKNATKPQITGFFTPHIGIEQQSSFGWSGIKVSKSGLEWDLLRHYMQSPNNETYARLTPFNSTRAEYCLSWAPKISLPRTVNLSIDAMTVVIVTNFIKAAIMWYLLFRRTEEPILTIGDAVQSFSEQEDLTTQSLGLVSRKDVVGKSVNWAHGASKKRFCDVRGFWVDGPGLTQWHIISLSYLVIIIAGVITLLVQTTTSEHKLSLWTVGFGSPHPWTMLSTPTGGLMSALIIVNLGQILLSGMYFAYNNFFTSMLLVNEWDDYFHDRKGLRISLSRVRGSQRSSYFLQLPYRFCLPLAVTSVILHWLASQSLYLVAVKAYSVSPLTSANGRTHVSQQRMPDSDVIACGYSPAAIFCVILVMVAMVFAAERCSSRRLRSGMPIASTCSAAIAAACHHPKDVNFDATQPLQWGIVRSNDNRIETCCFSSAGIYAPQDGGIYSRPK